LYDKPQQRSHEGFVRCSAPVAFHGQGCAARHCSTQWFINRTINKGSSIVNLENYFPVLLFILVGIGVGVVPQVLGKLLSKSAPDAAKLSPYECGFEAFEDARMKFDVRYYLVAILFILFDLETAFFFPWGVSMRELGWSGFVTMMVFIAEFVVGFWYIWKKGALDWE
jgi:NADH-quinone oxidoreductase subunit A